MTDEPQTWTAAIVVDGNGEKKRVLAVAPLADEDAADRWAAIQPMNDSGDFNIAVEGDMPSVRKGKQAGYLGCVRDATVLFEVRGVVADGPGVFVNILLPLVDDAGDGKICPTCGDPLDWVDISPPPEPDPPPEDPPPE